jgi:hypothetical protein
VEEVHHHLDPVARHVAGSTGSGLVFTAEDLAHTGVVEDRGQGIRNDLAH